MQTTFERKTRHIFIYYILLFFMGLATIILYKKGIYTNHIYIGLGCGVSAVSLIKIIQWCILLKNHEKRQLAEIQQNDERNIFIAKEAYSAFALLSIIFQFLLILITGLFTPNYGEILSYVLGGNSLILYFCFVYYYKKY